MGRSWVLDNFLPKQLGQQQRRHPYRLRPGKFWAELHKEALTIKEILFPHVALLLVVRGVAGLGGSDGRSWSWKRSPGPCDQHARLGWTRMAQLRPDLVIRSGGLWETGAQRRHTRRGAWLDALGADRGGGACCRRACWLAIARSVPTLHSAPRPPAEALRRAQRRLAPLSRAHDPARARSPADGLSLEAHRVSPVRVDDVAASDLAFLMITADRVWFRRHVARGKGMLLDALLAGAPRAGRSGGRGRRRV